jgi:DNA mismatch repair protein MutL
MKPPKIDLLPEHLIDQIKAGEVIERPGSLIKEIMENAVDAGATRLELHVKNNGLDLISLKDNGHGMRMNDLPLAFSRHATSKISRFEDIYLLHSFGFRGEALASIAAIAKVQCLSFTETEPDGSELRIEGGETILHVRRKKEGRIGTELIIQDLFFNTPARLKFVQSQNAEKKYIRSIAYSFVLSHPEIEFHLKFDEDEKDIYQIAATVEERLLTILPKGRDRLLTEERFYENYAVKVILIPDMFKAPVGVRNIYINNRYVLDKQLHRVISQTLLSIFGNDDWYYLAFFDLPADSIDVNVHPNKTVIKFMENSKLISLLTSTVKELAKPRGQSPTAEHQDSHSPVLPLGETTQNYQLLQERHDYNMDGLFSPHGLQADKTDHFWAEEFLIKKVEDRWIAINTKRLIAAYVKQKLEIESLSIPLMVSEPYPYKGIQEKTILALNDKGFEFEKLGPDTLVMRAIPEWMNGFPLRDVASILLGLENFESLQVRASDWSTSIWEEMIQCLGTTQLMKENILCGLEETLRGKLR